MITFSLLCLCAFALIAMLILFGLWIIPIEIGIIVIVVIARAAKKSKKSITKTVKVVRYIDESGKVVKEEEVSEN